MYHLLNNAPLLIIFPMSTSSISPKSIYLFSSLNDYHFSIELIFQSIQALLFGLFSLESVPLRKEILCPN